jgi:anti-sigma factor RsiW
MVEDERRRGLSCESARGLIHRLLDGELMDVVRREELEDHLASCTACREARQELGAVQDALRDLPEFPMPDMALQEVWKRTTRSGPATESGRGKARSYWRPAVAAAALALALWAAWSAGEVRSKPTPAEVARAAEETRMVLGLTARALRDAQQAAVKEVLVDEVSPALRRVPIRWPGATNKKRRASTNGV